jgi:hypothetical protein
MFKKKILFVSIIFFIAIILLELTLRYKYHLCDMILYSESNNYEYIFKPNQSNIFLNNKISYNSYSMRSPEVDTTCEIYLGFGDSIINGGNPTDQDSLATSILTNSLSKKYNKKIQFLNISCGSWGPDNCYAYFKEKINFKFKKIILFVSSHDSFDNMDFRKVVGVNPNYPNKQSYSAIYVLFDRYIIPRLLNYFSIKSKENDIENLVINKKKSNSVFNTGFQHFLEYSTNQHIPFLIYLHADVQELQNQKYNQQGQLIINFCKKNNIDLIKDINYIKNDSYRDGLHINNKGQKLLASLTLKNL